MWTRLINWLHQVKCLLLELGLVDVWVNQQVKNSVKLRLSDNCLYEMDNILKFKTLETKCILYRHLSVTV